MQIMTAYHVQALGMVREEVHKTPVLQNSCILSELACYILRLYTTLTPHA